jgi:hypothetical protein
MSFASDGGPLSVEPAALEEMGTRTSRAAENVGSARGSLSGATSAADGCAGQVAGSFGRLQSLLDVVLVAVDNSAAELGRTTSAAAGAYVTTDNSVFPGAAPGCPATP